MGTLLGWILEKLKRRRRPPRTKNFTTEEFACKDGTQVPEEYWDNLQRLMEQLEALRSFLGAPVKIVSGYRTKTYNDGLSGSAKNSKHLTAEAADIRVAGHHPMTVASSINVLIADKRMVQGGIGRYPKFTHYDIRGRRARWGTN